MYHSRVLFLAVMVSSTARAVDYANEVKPLLAARCYACHGSLQQKGGLRLDTVSLLLKGGDSGPAIVSGKSGESILIDHITGKARRMPPPSDGAPLDRKEIDTIKAWIDAGAKGSADERPEPDPRDHWAFRVPIRPTIPTVNSVWGKNSLDAFIAARHEKRGLAPRPEADRRVLLRRVTLDLTGLPPTAAEQAAFLADTSPYAYEKVVERLLASPHYGERWGRHWLDVWRYSDWWGLGSEVRNSQKHIWHWRDWTLEAMNSDVGYDQMLREMLAADELYPTDDSRLRATGFLARSYFKFNRNTWLEDVVEHTSKAFLGITMNCAKCHDHKYDPISQQDFYRFRAFFEPYQIRTDLTGSETDIEKNGVPRVFDCNLDTPTYLFIRGDEKNPRKTPIAPGLPKVLAREGVDIRQIELPTEAYMTGLRPSILANHLRYAEERLQNARRELELARQALNIGGTAQPPRVLAKGFTSSLWEVKSGRWTNKGEALAQEEVAATRSATRLKVGAPPDFLAHFKFTPTGGKTYHSVGLAFDVSDGHEVLVYLSAYKGGPKVQIAYKNGAEFVYPPAAAQMRPIKLNEMQDVSILVRGGEVNVDVNGRAALAYRLPIPRRPGALELITFDATATMHAFELTTLPTRPGLTPQQANNAVLVAEKALATAILRPEAIRKAVEADRLRTPAARRAANEAERALATAVAEEGVARAETKQLAAAQKALETARKKPAGETYTSLRGSVKTLESNVESEASRMKPFPQTSTGRRSALAKWFTARENPLTARVAANHIWLRHMGTPLVPTVFDFGRKGLAPSHPELLDWLAVELIENGWSMKHLHRLIVTSATYRMSSASAGATAERAADPENRDYWRMNSIRMESQTVRDSLLLLSGDLDPMIGGPPVPANAITNRRSLYFFHSHNEQNKFLSLFDDANVLECYRRTVSVLPQQGLALQNSGVAMDAASRIASRLEMIDPVVFCRTAFETVLAQTPTADELTACVEALKEFEVLAVKEKRTESAREARVLLIHALLNHNDFVTIR